MIYNLNIYTFNFLFYCQNDYQKSIILNKEKSFLVNRKVVTKIFFSCVTKLSF